MRPTFVVHPLGLRQKIGIVQRGLSRSQRQAVDIERLAQAVDKVGHLRPCQRITHAQTRQSIGLRKGTGNDEIRVLRQPNQGVRRRVEKLGVRLVQHHDDAGRHRGQKLGQRGVRQERPGRIIRIGDKDHRRVLTDRGPHGRKVMAKISRRHLNRRRIAGGNGQGINRKGMLGKHGRTPRRQKHPRGEFEHIVGTITQHDLIGTHTQPSRQRLFQREAIAIGIQRQAIQGRRYGPTGLGRNAQRVFVGSQFDDVRLLETQLARQLGDRLARHIRCNRTNVRQCVTTHDSTSKHTRPPQAFLVPLRRETRKAKIWGS